MSSLNQGFIKRKLKIHKGHFKICRHQYRPHPLIRFGGIYLEQLDFRIGDEITITAKSGSILITKRLGEKP